MKSNQTTKTGTTRRGFISKTGLLLAGSMLASSSPEESAAASAGLQKMQQVHAAH